MAPPGSSLQLAAARGLIAASAKPTRLAGWLAGEGGNVLGGQQTAAQQGLLVFAIKHENLDQSVLSGLE